ncbi:MAG TPA: hypothetical protein PLE19_19425 [Planctomycetota bacterium]|nr:hypothetical protein [Planctomycetota bacterium]HRR81220.1 hypothetical protein [Planctomycetota bacterium]HRT93549.1 hypothetical protein [Planctomycetota bacterium]
MRKAIAASLLLVTLIAGARGLGGEVLVIDRAETAGISAFRPMWDTPVVTAPDGVRVIKDSVIKDRGGAAVWWPGARDGGSKPGAMAFDALRRFLLVRFPDAADQISAKLNAGLAIEKVELVLPFKDEELWPEGTTGSGIGPEGGYEYRANWGVDDLYRKHRPTWHALAWALRKPWKADPKSGPTFNAYANGSGYWKRYGAADTTEDRFPRQFGPTPVHYQAPEGRMDVTPVLADDAFGKTLGERLRTLSDCGFLLRKWETYDHRYYTGCYEWATATGGRAIVIDTPRLVVQFGVPPSGGLPSPIAKEPPRGGTPNVGGKPTAVMPTAEELDALAKRYAPRKPDWMPEWQWARVRELLTLQQGENALDEPFWMQFTPRYLVERRVGSERRAEKPRSKGELAYEVWVDCLLAMQPRGWNGFEASTQLLPALVYGDALPGPARDVFTEYWTNWLMPDRPTAPPERHQDPECLDGSLVHPMLDQLKKVQATAQFSGGDSYFNKTGDWRGNKSFYRSGFCYTISTMNFNHTSAMGALLGGAVIGSERAMTDGRHGIENYPLRLWCWFDGTTQESIDHYYLSVTLTAQKMIADFGPTLFDRMLGKSILLKTVDELIGAYHPGLHRFIAGSCRTAPEHLLVTQDGVYHIVHSLSQKGVLRDLDNRDVPGGMPVIGQELSPAHVGRQTLQGPWAPDWKSGLVDSKPLPWEMTCTFKQWGRHVKQPIMRRSYLGHHYGLYSSDAQMGIIPILGQWRRADKPAERMQDVGTMLLRYGLNTTRLVNDAPGWIATYGTQATLQHKGKMIVVASPHPWLDPKHNIKSLQSTLALYNYEALGAPVGGASAPREPQDAGQGRPAHKLSWRIFADGEPITALPARLKAGQRITIQDGVSYIGIVPLPATDLGRTDEVVLSEGDEQEFGRGKFRAALVIDNYNLKGDAPLAEKADFAKVDRAWGGFVVEMTDATEFSGFRRFQSHIASAKLQTRDEPEQAIAHVKYASGKDTMELGVFTTYKEDEPLDQLFAYRRVNGAWPYLPEGVERDTPVAQQATTGRLEKNGAVLACEKGRMAYLHADPASDTFAGYNPLPDPTDWSLTIPGRIRVWADGKLGIAHIVVRPKAGKVTVDYATRPGAETAGMATALLLDGFPAPPAVTLNGQTLPELRRQTVDGRPCFLVPLKGL